MPVVRLINAADKSNLLTSAMMLHELKEATVTPYIFFTGKGGVGKTSLACATAVRLADAGKKVLLVSTDPASNLQDVLASAVNEKINPIKGLSNLKAININPEASAEEYRKRVLQPLKEFLPESELRKVREGLSGACTTEIASFDEFSRFISGEEEAGNFDVIIFDTAPTGHTLRLLELPAAWSSFTKENPDGASCLGPTSALKSSQERYNKVVSRLRDASQATFCIVTRAERSSLKEASRTSHELIELGMKNQQLLVNGVFKSLDKNDPFAAKVEALAIKELNNIPESIKELPIQVFPLLPYNILGLEKLRSLVDPELQRKAVAESVTGHKWAHHAIAGLDQLVDELTANKKSGLIMTLGKGGVGKTLTASALAIMIARKGFDVHLTTTDPAAHIQGFINQLKDIPEGLSIDRIDPKAETQRYIDKVLAQKGQNLDADGRRLLLEDLKSPCTEEVAVFHAFSKVISESKRKFVVIDTAPTGHTLLLLDTAGSYHREVLRNTTLEAAKVRTPYMALQDKDQSKIILVTLPETTPMNEATSLQEDLKRAGIVPYAWIINQSLSMRNDITDPLLKSRAMAEVDVIKKIKNELASQTYGIPYLAQEDLLPALLNFCENPVLQMSTVTDGKHA